MKSKLHDSFEEIFEYARKTLGFNHNLDNRLLNNLQEFRLLRDLFAHGDRIVNHIYRLRSKKHHYNVGDQIELTYDLLSELAEEFFNCVTIFDQAVIKRCPELKADVDIEDIPSEFKHIADRL